MGTILKIIDLETVPYSANLTPAIPPRGVEAARGHRTIAGRFNMAKGYTEVKIARGYSIRAVASYYLYPDALWDQFSFQYI